MKECTHCGGPNAPENRICDYCGMGFDEETIPEGSIDPREQAKLDEAAWKEANREKELVEFNIDGTNNQNVTINMPNGQSIRINDPIEKAATVAGAVLTGSTASTLKKIGSSAAKHFPGLEPDDPRFGPGPSQKKAAGSSSRPASKKSKGCLGLGCVIPAAIFLLAAAATILIPAVL